MYTLLSHQICMPTLAAVIAGFPDYKDVSTNGCYNPSLKKDFVWSSNVMFDISLCGFVDIEKLKN